MENGAAVFLRVKVCFIQVIPTSLEVKKKEKQIFTASNWPSPRILPIAYVVFLAS